MVPFFSQNIKYIKGVGPARAELLGVEMQIFTLRDLLFTFPTKHIDRSVVHKICELQEGMPYVQLRGNVVDIQEEGIGRKRRLRVTFSDGTGYIELVWFAGIKYALEHIKFNRSYQVFGKPSVFNGHFSISHPEIENINEGISKVTSTLNPVYSIPERLKKRGINSKVFSQIVQAAFDIAKINTISETLPAYFLEQHQLIGLTDALHAAHFPKHAHDLPTALRRLKFEELFFLQLDLLHYAQQRLKKTSGYLFPRIGENFNNFYKKGLTFELTGAKTSAQRNSQRPCKWQANEQALTRRCRIRKNHSGTYDLPHGD